MRKKTLSLATVALFTLLAVKSAQASVNLSVTATDGKGKTFPGVVFQCADAVSGKMGADGLPVRPIFSDKTTGANGSFTYTTEKRDGATYSCNFKSNAPDCYFPDRNPNTSNMNINDGETKQVSYIFTYDEGSCAKAKPTDGPRPTLQPTAAALKSITPAQAGATGVQIQDIQTNMIEETPALPETALQPSGNIFQKFFYWFQSLFK